VYAVGHVYGKIEESMFARGDAPAQYNTPISLFDVLSKPSFQVIISTK
jgi:hypothetical protein